MSEKFDNPKKIGRYDFRDFSRPPLPLMLDGGGEFWYETAQAAFDAGDSESARRLCGAAIERDPRNWRLHFLYGNCALEMRKLATARAAMETAARLAPEETAPKLRLVEIFLESGDDAQALRLMNMLHETQSENLEYRLLEIKSALNGGQCERAFEEARRILESKVLLEEPYAYLARAAVLSQRTAEVEEILEEGVLLYPSNSFLNEAVAHLASDKNEFVRALKHFENALEERPDNMALLLAYAFCLYQTGDVELAYRITGELRNSPHANLVVHQLHRQLETLVKKSS